jgi:hypothetical protein
MNATDNSKMQTNDISLGELIEGKERLLRLRAKGILSSPVQGGFSIICK